MTQLDRRHFLLGAAGLAGAGLLTACSSDDGGADGDTTADGTQEASIAFLIPAFPDGFRAPSHVVGGIEQRIAYALHDGIGEMRDAAPASLEFLVTFDGNQVAGGTIPRRADGILTPYYPLHFTPPATGTYTVSLPEHPDVAAHEFLAVGPEESGIPRVGDPLAAIETPTVDDPRGVTPICTRAEPCPFHDRSLADALAGGRPTVLSIATPGFCQTTICGPVIELLIDEAGNRSDLEVIHAEVYVDPQRDFSEPGGAPETTEVVQTLGLPYEPVLFVLDAGGSIVARLDTVYDRSELAEALALV